MNKKAIIQPAIKQGDREPQWSPEAQAQFPGLSGLERSNSISLIVERVRGTLVSLQCCIEGEHQPSDALIVSALDSCVAWLDILQKVEDAGRAAREGL